METEIAAIENILSDADLYARDPEKFTAQSNDLARKKEEKEEKENEWLELQILAEELNA